MECGREAGSQAFALPRLLGSSPGQNGAALSFRKREGAGGWVGWRWALTGNRALAGLRGTSAL